MSPHCRCRYERLLKLICNLAQLHPDRGWRSELRGGLTFSIGGWGPGAEGVRQADGMSLRGRALVLLVYGGFVLQQSQAKVAAPAPWKTCEHSKTGIKRRRCRNSSSITWINEEGNMCRNRSHSVKLRNKYQDCPISKIILMLVEISDKSFGLSHHNMQRRQYSTYITSSSRFVNSRVYTHALAHC